MPSAAVCAPSTVTTAPDTQLVRGSASHAATPPMSSGRPIRPSGLNGNGAPPSRVYGAAASSVAYERIQPGAIAFVTMPYRARSSAIDLHSAETPPLLAL